MTTLVANARMYAVTPEVEAIWRDLLLGAGRRAGVELAYLEHRAPAPLDDLWARDDLGLAFMCGWPFASSYPEVQPVAAPIPMSAEATERTTFSSTGGGGGRPGGPNGGGHAADRANPHPGSRVPRDSALPSGEEQRDPTYRTHLVVRAEDPARDLAGTFGRRLGWTVVHSQSGYNALRDRLLGFRRSGTALYAATIGPLVTPRRVVEALLAEEIDVGPLDSIWHGLLHRFEPATAARLRVVDQTEPTPAPLLTASETVDPGTVARLVDALLAAATDPELSPHLAALGLAGFAHPARADYGVLLRQAAAAEAAGYVVPG